MISIKLTCLLLCLTALSLTAPVREEETLSQIFSDIIDEFRNNALYREIKSKIKYYEELNKYFNEHLKEKFERLDQKSLSSDEETTEIVQILEVIYKKISDDIKKEDPKLGEMVERLFKLLFERFQLTIDIEKMKKKIE
ncbi:uncharacterized protein LOC126899622 [Daktulosphaira vitifoliae]|uniref:uncharacterized protein LOC126899622 n=1 Tax=Daktulosphaira vitifoliae TaxID=58002 RepID=UPI0021AA2918|nr:uncharacterized protein LOC126899622 [Daktulosphaira vitifoliae]